MNQIICPHCKKSIELTDAIIYQLSQKAREEERLKLKAQFEKAIANEKLIAQKLAKKELEDELKKANKEKNLLEQKLLKEEKEKNKFKETIEKEAYRKAEEEQRLKLKEKDLQLEEVRKVNEELKRKLEQGSQQRQGEVLELDLEEKLKKEFEKYGDEFVPIPKGVEGADIWQKVKFRGKEIGSIIYETKRTKQWSNLWLTKLKEDAAKISASEAIIVTQVLPDSSVSFDRKENVWITNYDQAISIAKYVRFLINATNKIKSSTSQTEEEWTKVRNYMLSDSFKHRMQTHFDAIKALKEMLETEKRTSMLRWKRQQAQIDKLDSNTVNFYAELKEIVNNLPELEELETPLLSNGIDEKEQESFI